MDYSQITGVVDFAAAVQAIGLVAGLLAVARMAVAGAQMVLSMIGGASSGAEDSEAAGDEAQGGDSDYSSEEAYQAMLDDEPSLEEHEAAMAAHEDAVSYGEAGAADDEESLDDFNARMDAHYAEIGEERPRD